MTRIGFEAFQGCAGITDITIPDGVTDIEDGAFESCSSLASVALPDSLTGIGDRAFQYCANLMNMTIPDGVTSIGDVAFSNCHRLVYVKIPDSVVSVGADAFCFCDNLLAVTVPEGVSADDDIFSGCDSLCIWGAEGGDAQRLAENEHVSFAPIRETVEELCQDYLLGDFSAGRFFMQLNQREDIEEAYDRVEDAFLHSGDITGNPTALTDAATQNEKIGEYRRFCSLLSALRDMRDKKPEMLMYLVSHEIGDREDMDLAIAYLLTNSGVQDALMDKVYQPKQELRILPAVWTEEALAKFFGKTGAFAPASAQANTWLLVLDSKSQTSNAGQITDIPATSLYPVYLADDFLSALIDGSGGAIKITGDPNMASVWLYFRIAYPFAGTYGSGDITTKAYNCELTLTAYDKVNRTELAHVTFGSYYGNTITTSNPSATQIQMVPTINGQSDKMQEFLDEVLGR